MEAHPLCVAFIAEFRYGPPTPSQNTSMTLLVMTILLRRIWTSLAWPHFCGALQPLASTTLPLSQLYHSGLAVTPPT